MNLFKETICCFSPLKNSFKIILMLEWFLTGWPGSLLQPLSPPSLVSALCNFMPWPTISQPKLNNVRYRVTQNCNFGTRGSYFTEKMSYGFPSDFLRLLDFNSVFHGDSWKQHEGYLLHAVAAAATLGECWCFVPQSEEAWLTIRWRSSTEKTPEPKPSKWAM